MDLELKCKCCGQPFEPTCHISRQKFCSKECRIKYCNAKRDFGEKPEVCPECGVCIEQSGEPGRWRRFCSDRCRVRYHEKRRQEKRKNQGRPTQVCPNCGVEFEPEWGKVRRFCCDSCRLEWWKEYHRANPKEQESEQICVCCGKIFIADRWHGGEYCNRDCYLRTMAKTRTQITCAWCGEWFTALSSLNRKYCSKDCHTAARHDPGGYKKAKRRLTYHNPEEWQELLREATRKTGSSQKRGKRVWLVCGITSMYTGLDGLLGIIRYQLNRNPFDGGVYVFCDAEGTMLKYLEWDGAGFTLGKRRAQSGSYPWPPSEAGQAIEITEKEFEFLRTKSIVPIGYKAKPKRRKKSKKISTKKPS